VPQVPQNKRRALAPEGRFIWQINQSILWFFSNAQALAARLIPGVFR
jgi:hypothetical protein